MKVEGLPLGKSSKYLLARKHFQQWRILSKESKIYRATLFALCNGECPTCGVDMILSFNEKENERGNSATLDHITPLIKVQEHSKFGLMIMCKDCNSKKSYKVSL
jgi:5-methylcytosine-specific restriction endonuclease McrA